MFTLRRGYTCDRCGKYFYAVKQREHHVAHAERLCSKKVLLTNGKGNKGKDTIKEKTEGEETTPPHLLEGESSPSSPSSHSSPHKGEEE